MRPEWKSIGSSVFIIFSLLVPSLALAQGNGPKGGPTDKGVKEDHMQRMEKHAEEMFSKLGLSEDQRKALRENRRKHRESVKNAHEAMKANMTALGEELKKEQIDENKLRALAEESKKWHAQKVDAQLEAMLELRKILTQEQFVEFSRMMEEKKSKWDERKDKRKAQRQERRKDKREKSGE